MKFKYNNSIFLFLLYLKHCSSGVEAHTLKCDLLVSIDLAWHWLNNLVLRSVWGYPFKLTLAFTLQVVDEIVNNAHSVSFQESSSDAFTGAGHSEDKFERLLIIGEWLFWKFNHTSSWFLVSGFKLFFVYLVLLLSHWALGQILIVPLRDEFFLLQWLQTIFPESIVYRLLRNRSRHTPWSGSENRCITFLILLMNWNDASILQVFHEPVFWIFFNRECKQTDILLKVVQEGCLISNCRLSYSMHNWNVFVKLGEQNERIDFVIKVQLKKLIGIAKLGFELLLAHHHHGVPVVDEVLNQGRCFSKELNGNVDLTLIIRVLNYKKQHWLLVSPCSRACFEEILISAQFKGCEEPIIISNGLATIEVHLFVSNSCNWTSKCDCIPDSHPNRAKHLTKVLAPCLSAVNLLDLLLMYFFLILRILKVAW